MKTVKSLLATGIIGVGSVASYIQYRVSENKKLLEKIEESDAFMDLTRPGNDSFGINWGFKADAMVR